MSPYLALFLIGWACVLGSILIDAVQRAYDRSPRVHARRIAKLLENDK